MFPSAKFRACHVSRDGKTPKRNIVQPALLLVFVKYSRERRLQENKRGGQPARYRKVYCIGRKKEGLKRDRTKREAKMHESRGVK